MRSRRVLLIGGVAAVTASFLSFTAMDAVPDGSTTQDALNIAGYVLVAIALFLFFKGFRTPT